MSDALSYLVAAAGSSEVAVPDWEAGIHTAVVVDSARRVSIRLIQWHAQSKHGDAPAGIRRTAVVGEWAGRIRHCREVVVRVMAGIRHTVVEVCICCQHGSKIIRCCSEGTHGAP